MGIHNQTIHMYSGIDIDIYSTHTFSIVFQNCHALMIASLICKKKGKGGNKIFPKAIGGFWARKYQGQVAFVAPQRPMMPFPTE